MNRAMAQTDFLVVEMATGTVGVFPGHADHEHDEHFAQQMRHRILKRCATRDEANEFVKDLTAWQVAEGLL